MSSVIDLLEKWGCKEMQETARSRVFFSPFRDETKGSFHVYKDSGRWKDFGHVGIDGNDKGNLFMLVKEYLYSRGMSYNNTDVFTYLESEHIPYEKASGNIDKKVYESKVKILKTNVQLEKVLWTYIYYERKITKKWLINRYLLNVDFELKEKTYYALGFKNDKGGFELRNKFWKGASGKAITTIKGQSKKVDVFEGFTDFLTHELLFTPYYDNRVNHAIIMNSKSMLTDTIKAIQNMDVSHVNLWKDNDADGEKVLALIKENLPTQVVYDCSKKYENHKDLNEAHVSGAFQKMTLGLG